MGYNIQTAVDAKSKMFIALFVSRILNYVEEIGLNALNWYNRSAN